MIQKPILHVLQQLQQHGEVYIVGGYLRDTYIGIKPKDIDLTTNIPFSQLKTLIPSLHYTEQGEKIGVGRFQKNGLSFEISSYTTTIKKEMRHKDFTINALYHDGKTLHNIEYAELDLKNRFIRPHDDFLPHCETNPQAYLRAIRIASKINGALDNSLRFLMKENKQIFHQNHENRIRQEGYELLLSTSPQVGFNILHDLGFLPKKTDLPPVALQFDASDIPYILAFLSLHSDMENIETFVQLFAIKEKHLVDAKDILALDDSSISFSHPKAMQTAMKWNRYKYQLEPEKRKAYFESLKKRLSDK